MVLRGHAAYELQFNESDKLSASQKGFVEAQLKQFDAWWDKWPGKSDG
jgi:4-hydroxy-tetrahydrodipicolinate synthase